MCLDDDFDAMHAAQVSRRTLGKLGLGAGLFAALPKLANAAEVTESEVTIKTADGTCDAHFVHPTSGAHAAILVWPGHLRPAPRIP